MLLQPVQKNEALAADIRAAKDAGRFDAFDIWWLAQSGFLIQWNKKCLLFDPYLSDSLSIKYAGTTKPHVRMSELVIRPELLNMIDLVTSSHNHTDHLDRETLAPLLRENPTIHFIIPEANRKFVCERVQCPLDFPMGMNDETSLDLHGFHFTGIPAAHNELERDELGRCRYMGYIVQFGPFAVYHSGDTLWYEGLPQWLQRYPLDVAFLPINGNDPSRGVAGNLNGREAAALGKEANVRWVIPHHYDLFAFNTADPAEFEAACQQLGQPYRVMKLGEKVSVTMDGLDSNP